MMAPTRKGKAPAPRHVMPVGCAVCGRPTTGAHRRTLDEAPYVLCSAECARLFDESPRAYAYEPPPEPP